MTSCFQLREAYPCYKRRMLGFTHVLQRLRKSTFLNSHGLAGGSVAQES